MKINEKTCDRITQEIAKAIMRATLSTKIPPELVPVAHALYGSAIHKTFHPDASRKQVDRLNERLGEVARVWIDEVAVEKKRARVIVPTATEEPTK